MSAQNERSINITDLEKEAQAIIEKARVESERILAEAHRTAELTLSDMKTDTTIPNNVLEDSQEKAKQIMTASISSTQEHLEDLENKARKNSPELIQRIVKIIMGTQ